MKFCKNLQRVAEISDPAWAPYWLNYKVLKKLINQLPSLVPADAQQQQQQHGDSTTETSTGGSNTGGTTTTASGGGTHPDVSSSSQQQHPQFQQQQQQQQQQQPIRNHGGGCIGNNPREVSFFKVLHAELRKAAHFFDKTQEEFALREERVRRGLEITKSCDKLLCGNKWRLMSQSIYRLYRELLLLETFCIMTYCGFSKILKKHDKVTGYRTCPYFMNSIVNKASFTHYPRLLTMISRCERLYEEVTHRLVKEGTKKNGGLLEDERLFINMIQVLNDQVIESSDDDSLLKEKHQSRRRSAVAKLPSSGNESPETTTLRELVEENEKVVQKNIAGRWVVSDCAANDGTTSQITMAGMKRGCCWDDDSIDSEDDDDDDEGEDEENNNKNNNNNNSNSDSSRRNSKPPPTKRAMGNY